MFQYSIDAHCSGFVNPSDEHLTLFIVIFQLLETLEASVFENKDLVNPYRKLSTPES